MNDISGNLEAIEENQRQMDEDLSRVEENQQRRDEIVQQLQQTLAVVQADIVRIDETHS